MTTLSTQANGSIPLGTKRGDAHFANACPQCNGAGKIAADGLDCKSCKGTGLKSIASDSAVILACDRDSVREYDRDGRLRVSKTRISKANVCPYRGKEIPGYEALGLEPGRIYNLLRDPDELHKAVQTLNGVPLLRKHVPVNADDHHPYDVVGSLGTDAEFDGEYLTNSLFVNAKEAIEGIKSGKKRELSAGYHYVPDMTAGNFGGIGYDGVMRDIVFNHVALVEDGRAGPDVLVGDEALKENDDMKPTRFAALVLSTTAAHVAPLLAMDATLPVGTFKGLTTKNFKDKKAELLTSVRSSIDGKLRKGLALDASMKGLAKAIDAFEEMEKADDAAPEEMEEAGTKVGPLDAPEPDDKEKPGFDAEPMKGFLREKGMSEDDIKAVCDMMPPDWQKPAADKDPDMVSKPAMDAALAEHGKKIRETERGIRVALADVKPWVGELPATLAFDSAADVHRKALTMLGVDGATTMHADALLPVLKSQPKPGSQRVERSGETAALAMDASAVSKAAKIAPGLENISQI